MPYELYETEQDVREELQRSKVDLQTTAFSIDSNQGDIDGSDKNLSTKLSSSSSLNSVPTQLKLGFNSAASEFYSILTRVILSYPRIFLFYPLRDATQSPGKSAIFSSLKIAIPPSLPLLCLFSIFSADGYAVTTGAIFSFNLPKIRVYPPPSPYL